VLVFSDVYYPGWRATLDGQPVPIRRADYLFRAVEVPAGRSQIVLTYSPIHWWVGLGLALVTLGVLAAWILVSRLQRRIP